MELTMTRPPRLWIKTVICIAIGLFPFTLPAANSYGQEIGYQSLSGIGPEETGVNSSTGTVLPDLFTGTMSFTLPIEVVPGRNGMQPDIQLTYRSSGGYGWVGYGWELEIGAIVRNIKAGVNYNADDFVFRMPGANVELVYVGSDVDGNREYRAKIEGDFSLAKKIQGQDGNTAWIVTDTTGKRYFFGQTPESRQDNFNESADPPYQIFKWGLDRVDDPNGNYMTISYYKETGQIYIKQIDYAGSETKLPTNRVKFYLDKQPRRRNPTLHTSNFPVSTSQVLKTIDIVSNNHRVRAYNLAYRKNSIGIRALLESVQQFGQDAELDDIGTIYQGSSLPPTILHYSQVNNFLKTPRLWLDGNGPTGPIYNNGFNYTGDFNGDGKSDWMYQRDGWHVALSTGGAFKEPQRWLSATNSVGNTYNEDYQFVGDFNGDGKTDWMYLGPDVTGWFVALSTGHGFLEPEPWLPYEGPSGPANDQYHQHVADFNGDGTTDFMYFRGGWHIALSNGNGFDPPELWLDTSSPGGGIFPNPHLCC
jgi:hypothetical protein